MHTIIERYSMYSVFDATCTNRKACTCTLKYKLGKKVDKREENITVRTTESAVKRAGSISDNIYRNETSGLSATKKDPCGYRWSASVRTGGGFRLPFTDKPACGDSFYVPRVYGAAWLGTTRACAYVFAIHYNTPSSKLDDDAITFHGACPHFGKSPILVRLLSYILTYPTCAFSLRQFSTRKRNYLSLTVHLLVAMCHIG